jgi:general secretion pathway protein D
MKLTKIFTLILALCLAFGTIAYAAPKNKKANDPVVEINFSDLKIVDFVKMVSKLTGKNIMINADIQGSVDFITEKPVRKSQLFELLISVLDSKGFTIVDTGKGYLKVIPSVDAVKYNLPVGKSSSMPQMITKIIKLENVRANDGVAAIKPMLSKNGSALVSPESNSIVISDFASNISTIQSVLKSLEGDNSKQVKFYPLQYAKSGLIIDNLVKIASGMFNQGIASQKTDVLKDDATNSIVIVGNSSNIEKIVAYIKLIDKKEEFGSTQHTAVINLKNAESDSVVKILNEIYSKKVYPKDAPRPIFSSDPQLNSVIIVSALDELEDIKEAVNSLDLERQQVYVKAKIVEISENKSAQIGAQYGLEGATAGSKGLYSFAANMGGSSIALSSTALGLMSFDIPALKEGLALGASISLLQSEGAANVLSEPSLLCINNQESSIYVGSTLSVISQTTVGASTTDLTKNSYTRQDIGLTLKVKPRLSTDNKVTLAIETKLEDLVPNSAAGLPTTTKREVKTTAIVSNGESVIIGGLIRDNRNDSESKVPLLGDVPLLGNLFTYTNKSGDKINLVILLTPYIIDKSTDLVSLRKKLTELDKIQDEYVKNIKLKKNK